jgi:hypothetical protein
MKIFNANAVSCYNIHESDLHFQEIPVRLLLLDVLEHPNKTLNCLHVTKNIVTNMNDNCLSL